MGYPAQTPANRRRWLICLYLGLAVPCAIVLLYLFNPTVQTNTKDYLHSLVGSPEPASAPAEEVQVDLPTELQTLPEPQASSSPQATEELQTAVDVPDQATTPTPTQSQAFHTQSEASTGASRSPFPSSLASLTTSSSSGTATPASTGFDDDKWWFQADLDPEEYRLPKFDIGKLRYLSPHNYRGVGRPTYATYYASRNATLQDPFFISALQIVYRLLWDDAVKSDEHPVTVFVAPFVPDEHRQYFAAAGALVREVSLIPYTPKKKTFGRWRDMFSKLEMWRQLDFSRIAYMDSDAFPVNKTDAIFDAAHEQKCKPDLLPEEDKQFASTICDYVLSGCPEAETAFFQGMNAGVMVMKPNRAMYSRLLREIYNENPKYDTTYMEQGYLNWMYRKDGPFPYEPISKAWNAPPDFHTKGKENNIVHDKMWAHIFDDKDLWVTHDYKQRWTNMLNLYESEDFVRMRDEDQERMLAEIH